MSSLKGMIAAVGLIALVATVWVYGRSNKLRVMGQTVELRQQRPDQASRTLSGDEIVAGYKQWTRVNPVPALMHSQIATLCAPATARLGRMDQGNPHRDKFITVYVNEIGRRAMMEERVPRFPQGSVIVKEKLTSRDSTVPELLTVMIKRESGHNIESGDWEFMVLDGQGKNFQARGKLDRCLGCHVLVKDTDYVSRSYLPDEVRRSLK